MGFGVTLSPECRSAEKRARNRLRSSVITPAIPQRNAGMARAQRLLQGRNQRIDRMALRLFRRQLRPSRHRRKNRATAPLEAYGYRILQSLRGTADGMDLSVITETSGLFRTGNRLRGTAQDAVRRAEVSTSTRAGIHADGLLKDQEIYNIFDTAERSSDRPAARRRRQPTAVLPASPSG